MSKRVQVTLTDGEYQALYELSELRGESMSSILASEITGFNLELAWSQEVRARKHHEKQQTAAEREMKKAITRVRGEHQKKLL